MKNLKHINKCPICESSSKKWVTLPNLSLRRCLCGHCFTSAESIKLKEEYTPDYFLETHKNWFDNPNYSLFSFLAFEIKRNRPKSILDIGCGNGSFLKYLLKDFKDIDLVGIDLSKAANFEEKINYIVGDFLTKNFNRKFDVLVSLAVIEHLDDINGFVKKCYEILNKNGIAYVMTLNESSILYQLSNILRKIGFPSFFIRLYDGHHLNHFSQKSLLELLTKDNLFKIVKVRNHNIPLRSIYQKKIY